MVFLIPKELGLYKKYGVAVDVVQVTGGLSMRTLASGYAPLAFTGSTLAITTAQAGLDVVIILGITNRLNYDIWARPEIKIPGALRGKKFAIATFGGPSHTAAVLMLKHFKLDDKRDGIAFLTIGSEPARVQALLSGSVDATVPDPSVAAVLKEKGFSYLGNFADLGIPVTGNTMVSTKRYVRENAGIVPSLKLPLRVLRIFSIQLIGHAQRQCWLSTCDLVMNARGTATTMSYAFWRENRIPAWRLLNEPSKLWQRGIRKPRNSKPKISLMSLYLHN